jgi:hypothetical protein
MNKELELALFNKNTHYYITIDCDELCNNYFKNESDAKKYLKNIINNDEHNRYNLTLTKNKYKITFNMNNIDNIINNIINYYKIVHIF